MQNNLIIGNVSLENNMLLAPMAGITDLPMRLLAKDGGAGIVYTEMVSSKGLVYDDIKTKMLLRIRDEERPVAAQIFGGDAYSMSEAAKKVRDLGADIIDINLGCPVRKVAKAGAGAKLLANEKLTEKILKDTVKSVDIPVTIKIRTGLLPGQNIAPDIIKIAQESGIKMVAVHARPASQGHSGPPDIDAFAKACENAQIPIIANGGIIDEETAKKFADIPNCSGLMIGRGSIANYNIFKRLKYFFETGEKLPAPTIKERIQWFEKHAKYSTDHYGERMGFVLMRKVAHYYIKDLPDAAKIRDMFNKVNNMEDFKNILNVIRSKINNISFV